MNFSRRRRAIFVETQRQEFQAPSGATSSQSAAPDGAFYFMDCRSTNIPRLRRFTSVFNLWLKTIMPTSLIHRIGIVRWRKGFFENGPRLKPWDFRPPTLPGRKNPPAVSAGLFIFVTLNPAINSWAICVSAVGATSRQPPVPAFPTSILQTHSPPTGGKTAVFAGSSLKNTGKRPFF